MNKVSASKKRFALQTKRYRIMSRRLLIGPSVDYNNQMSHPSPPYQNIPGLTRDDEYRRIFRRDTKRQTIRRVMRAFQCQIERLRDIPRWEQAALDYTAGKLDKPTLSTCIITMNAAERIRPLLQYIRPFSDQIVVGVDSKTTDNTFAACEGLVDELFIIESDALTCNAGLEPLVKRCSGDWVLRLDDDEFPEPALARWLPGILTQPEITHYKLPRLHLSHHEPLQWINDGYLYPDYQMRLFKNDRSLLTFPGAVAHSSIEAMGKRGKLHTPNLIHLNMAINPRFKRETKLKTYIERLNGGWVHPVNEHALLFENFSYKIEPYIHNNSVFLSLLSETIRHQREIYLTTRL